MTIKKNPQETVVNATTARVWYWKHDDKISRDLIMGYDWAMAHGVNVKPSNITETHVMLKELPFPIYLDAPISRLEYVFQAMQGESWSPNGEARSLIREKGLSHTSMSVGDVVEIGEFFFMVDSMGWVELSTGVAVS